jgi:hypothetical protein
MREGKRLQEDDIVFIFISLERSHHVQIPDVTPTHGPFNSCLAERNLQSPLQLVRHG